jgi:hypothetical protein
MRGPTSISTAGVDALAAMASTYPCVVDIDRWRAAVEFSDPDQ